MRRLSLALLTSAVALLAAAQPTQAQATDPPEELTLEACGDTRAAVSFPHKAHFEELECTNSPREEERPFLTAMGNFAAGEEIRGQRGRQRK